MKINTLLNYGGNTEEAFRFYEQHLGGKITMMMKHSDAPVPTQNTSSKNDVLHARITIGETEIYGNDVPPEHFKPMRSVYLSLGASSVEEAEHLHALLSEGGEIFTPMQETFFAFRFSVLRDKFGTSWMILHSRPMPS